MSSQRYLGTSQLTCQRSKLCLGYERHENVHGEGTFQGVRAIFHGRHARTPDRGRVLVSGRALLAMASTVLRHMSCAPLLLRFPGPTR